MAQRFRCFPKWLGSVVFVGLLSATPMAIADNNVLITGTFAGKGIECPLFKIDTGEVITLSGRVPDMTSGEHWLLEGRWARFSQCMQGREFNVLEARKSE